MVLLNGTAKLYLNGNDTEFYYLIESEWYLNDNCTEWYLNGICVVMSVNATTEW